MVSGVKLKIWILVNKTKIWWLRRKPGQEWESGNLLELEVDASKNGLGAAMFQDGKAIAFASKSLTTAEKNYAQIEKELCAIVFGCERFYQYVYGRAATVFTDHKPLEAIMRKSLAETPPREDPCRWCLIKEVY